MNAYLKTTIFAVSAFALLATGYSFGLLVQDKYDRRVNAVIELEQAMKLHKAASVGNYEYMRRDAMNAMMHGAMHLDDGLEFDSLPLLLRESVYGRWDTGYHRAALAHIIGFRQVRPEILFPRELQPELTAFVPQTESEQRSLDHYAKWDPAGY